jgi:ribosomal 30S subunit maturation factor RimM
LLWRILPGVRKDADRFRLLTVLLTFFQPSRVLNIREKSHRTNLLLYFNDVNHITEIFHLHTCRRYVPPQPITQVCLLSGQR